MRLQDLTEDERRVIVIIFETGGDDYEVWPRIDSRLMPSLTALDERGMISVMGDGDIRILDSEIRQQLLSTSSNI